MDCTFFCAFLLLSCVGFSIEMPLGVEGGDVSDPQPQQVHISATGDVSEMMITWVTTAPNISSFVEYGLAGDGFSLAASGVATKFVDGGDEHRVLYIHRVKLAYLKPATSYDYHCGSMQGWSSVFTFRTLPYGNQWSPRLCIYGDLGTYNSKSMGYIQEELAKDDFDAILHVGDMAYNLDSDNARIGDAFMNQIVPIASRRPYMTCPGNHEYAYNFSNYRYRFSMPGDSEGLYYSWNIGPVHIISISTEIYFDFLKYGIRLLDNQYNWLKADLEKAASPENREKRPWIIVMGHRPMYCSSDDQDDCTKINSILRTGVTYLHLFPLESLFYKYSVDMLIWAHEHNYQRLFPIYDLKVYNGSTEHPYTNPKAPVHIITGSAGCQEKHDAFIKEPRPFNAYRSTDYGYTRMKVYNSTHLFLDQVSVDQGGKVIDEMWLIKDKHGPEAWN